MSHLLLIDPDSSIPQSLQDAFSATNARLVTRKSSKEAQAAVERGTFDIAVIHSKSGLQALTAELKALRAMSPEVFLIVISDVYAVAEETAAFDNGADLYFSQPLPPQTLTRILQRTLEPTATSSGYTETRDHSQAATESPQPSPLHILRDFSQVLGFSLDYKAFTQHFILKLREHISFSRIGIFIEGTAKQSLVKKNKANHLACIASLGLPIDLVDCFQLSRELGIAHSLHEHPRVLSLNELSKHFNQSQQSAIQKEFKILGCHIAVPISDREGTIGVAVLNGPVTDRNYSDDELQLLYLLMEELGLAIQNSRLHAELGRHGALIENVLSSMASGALVISEDLDILYANRAAKRFLKIYTEESRPIEFAELPHQLAAPIHRAVENGELSEAFLIPGSNPDEVYQVSIYPFSHNEELALLPRPTMVCIEDFTKIEKSKQTAQETTKTELIRIIAERFAHEIRNSLVPLTTHMQLMDKKIDQPKFQTSLKSALEKETGRIKRFSEQMLHLAQNSNPIRQSVDIGPLVLNGFESAKKQSGNTTIHLKMLEIPKLAKIAGDPSGITYAFEEIFLNSIQANTENDKPIEVTILSNDEGTLTVTLCDGGPGFTDQTIQQATEPFYTSRNTGVGLGLSVAKKIIESHHGIITLNQRSEHAHWDLQIELPTNLAPHP